MLPGRRLGSLLPGFITINFFGLGKSHAVMPIPIDGSASWQRIARYPQLCLAPLKLSPNIVKGSLILRQNLIIRACIPFL